MEDANSRNLSVHYDKNPIRVYNDILKLSEDEEAKRAGAFLVVLESLSILTEKYLTRNVDIIEIYFKSQRPYDLSMREIVNSFHDKTNRLSITLDNTIEEFGKRLDGLILSCNKPKVLAKKLGVEDSIIKKFTPIVESIHPGLHLHFIYLDLTTATKAYLNSEYYLEKQLNLRRLRIVIYEGFKKIYGFTDNQESNSFFRRNIYSLLCNSNNFTTITKLKTIENDLNQLRKYKDFKDEKKREYSVHYRYKKQDNIISIFHQLIDSNAILEMEKALRMLKLLPTIIELNTESLKVVDKNKKDKIDSANREQQAKFDDLFSKIENSNTDNKIKQDSLEILYKVKAMYISFLNKK